MARKQGSHAGITGPRIRDAARRLFAGQGYAAVSMRQIAAEVGVQAGALYTYTADKQALLFDLMQAHLEDLLAAWAAEQAPEDPVARLEHFTRFHIAYHLDRPDEVFIAYMELRNLAPENFTVIEDLRRQYEDVLEDILQAGVARGAFDLSDTRLSTFALIAMLTGVTAWYKPGGRLDASQIAETYWDMVRRSVGVVVVRADRRTAEMRPA